MVKFSLSDKGTVVWSMSSSNEGPLYQEKSWVSAAVACFLAGGTKLTPFSPPTGTNFTLDREYPTLGKRLDRVSTICW